MLGMTGDSTSIKSGIRVFFTLNESRLRQWEALPDVQRRIQPLVARFLAMRQTRHLRDRRVGPLCRVLPARAASGADEAEGDRGLNPTISTALTPR